MPNIGTALAASLNNALVGVTVFIPKFVAGLLVLLIGVILGLLLKQLIVGAFKALKLERMLKKYGVPQLKDEMIWANIFGEIVRWFVIIVFLIPTADIWGLPRIITVLNDFLFYLPNVFVAAVIALVGFVLARIAHDIILASAKGIDNQTAVSIAVVARWAINIFVILAVLNQLGVASSLIQILFTGFVAMIAIAGGIAFGLGGQSTAQDILEGIRKRFK